MDWIEFRFLEIFYDTKGILINLFMLSNLVQLHFWLTSELILLQMIKITCLYWASINLAKGNFLVALHLNQNIILSWKAAAICQHLIWDYQTNRIVISNSIFLTA
jgi:hypothetical protein